MLDVAAGRRRALDQVEALSIKAASIDAEVRTLSGGNQQKVQIARWLAAESRILIMIDPTRGVDVGARREIKRIWSELGARGHAILLASTDAEELVDTCDRVVVMSHGRRVGELAARRAVGEGPAQDGDRWLSPGATAGEVRTDGGTRAMRDGLVLRLTRVSALRNSMLLLVLAAVWLFFYFATDGTFLTQRNLVLLALQTSIVSLAAISAVMLIVTRNFDLSVGSAVAFVGVILAVLTVKHDVNPVLAVLAAIAGGVLMGAWQGVLGDPRRRLVLHRHPGRHALFPRHLDDRHQRRHRRAAAALADRASPPASCRPPGRSRAVLVTLAGYAALRLPRSAAARRWASRPGWRRSCRAPSPRRRWSPRLPSGSSPGRACRISCCWSRSARSRPSSSCAAPAIGAQLYAIGGNPEAARLAGINLGRVIFWNFVIAGLGYGITGVALTARVSGAIGGSAGLFLELDAIAAAIIGGTSLAGGRGRVLGALLGALLMGSLNNGMSLMNVPTFYQDTARGDRAAARGRARSAQPSES